MIGWVTNRFRVLLVLLLVHGGGLLAQPDTLRVMAYNVLYYGDVPGCQGGHSATHDYLKTIIAYTNPDILGLEKMAAIPMYTGDHSGTGPAGFADSVVQFALNAAYTNRYAYCTYSNAAMADDMAVLFYNREKLGFASVVSSYANVTDFNTYKLYYNPPSLAVTHDTTFLYVTLNHTESGSSSSDAGVRASQIAGEMGQLHTRFTQLPNLINMGDFNVHNSSEACYQLLVNPGDAGFRFYDPPFSVDALYTYPADWDASPALYAANLTTSTRSSPSLPNSCGTGGGGKSWYDHIFLSGAIVNNSQHIRYIPHSYTTIGNDGNRVGASINGSPTNASAPAAVIDALFHMSNKYPVMVSLAIENAPASVSNVSGTKEYIHITNPVGNEMRLAISTLLLGKDINLLCTDMTGRCVLETFIHDVPASIALPCSLIPGIYHIRFVCNGEGVGRAMVVKQ